MPYDLSITDDEVYQAIEEHLRNVNEDLKALNNRIQITLTEMKAMDERSDRKYY